MASTKEGDLHEMTYKRSIHQRLIYLVDFFLPIILSSVKTLKYIALQTGASLLQLIIVYPCMHVLGARHYAQQSSDPHTKMHNKQKENKRKTL